MNVTTRQIAILLTLGSLAGAGAVVACSDNGSTATNTKKTGDGGTGTKDGGGNTDCPKNLPFLPDPAKGVFCPDLTRDAGSGSTKGGNCPNTTDACCYYQGGDFKTKSLSTCEANTPPEFAPTCAFAPKAGETPVEFQCFNDSQCGGKHCCMISTDAGAANVGQDPDSPGCAAALKGFKVAGTRCMATCPADVQVTLCTATDEATVCTGGKKCKAFATNSLYFGACR